MYFVFLLFQLLVQLSICFFLFTIQSSYRNKLPDTGSRVKMLVGFLAASFLLLALISWGKKRAKFRLPGAGPYIPFIGHYEVNTILLLALILWGVLEGQVLAAWCWTLHSLHWSL
jgi:hypothetical protein